MINIEKLTATNYFEFLGVILDRDFPTHKIIEREKNMEIILGTDYDNPEKDFASKKYQIKNDISEYFKFEKSLSELDELIYVSSTLSDEDLLDFLFSIYVFWKYKFTNCNNILSRFNPENFILGFNHLSAEYADIMNNLKEFGITEVKVAKINDSHFKIRVINSFEGIDIGYPIHIANK